MMEQWVMEEGRCIENGTAISPITAYSPDESGDTTLDAMIMDG